jgi:uncharacterized protein with beta-barrel porin domain
MNGNTLALAGVNEADDILVATNSATAFELKLDDGDIVAAGITQANSGAMVMTISDDEAASSSFTVTGNVTAASAALTIQTDDNGVKLVFGGNITETGVATLIKLDATGSVEFNGTTKNIDSIINGLAADEGTMTLAGVTEFDDAVGAVNAIEAINVSAAKSGDFNAAVDAGVVTNLGTLIFEGALGANTITNSGTITINAATTNVAGNDQTALVMHTTGSIVNFTDTGAENQNLIVTGTTDGFGTLNFFDSVDDAAAASTTLVADSLIGTDGNRIGTINVGKSDGTKGGGLVGVNAAAIFADNVNITGGNHEDEDSILSLHEALTSTAITLTAGGAGQATLNTLTATTAITGTVDSGSGTDGAGLTLIDADIATQFASNIGASVAIEKMDIGAIKVDIDGATNVIESVLFSGDGTLELDAASAQTLTSTITATTNEHGLITNANTSGVLTFAGVVGAEDKRIKEISLLDNTDTTFENAIFALDLDIDTAAADDVTTFTIGNVVGNDAANTGALDVAGGTFVLDTAVVSGTTVFDVNETTGSDAGVELRALVIQPSANFTQGTVTFIDGDVTASIDDEDVAALSVTDTALTDFTVNATTGVADVTITAAAKSGSKTGAELGVTANQGTAIQQLMEAAIAGDTTLMNTLNESLTGLNSGLLSTTTDLAKQAAPQTDTISGSAVQTRAMTGTVQGIVSNRMASLRSGDAYVTGMSAGNGMSANSGFIQAFGSEGEQDNVTKSGATTFGYDTETSGVAIGFDGMTDNGSTIGLSASYSTTDIDGKGTGKSKNSIDSHTVSIYADKATENGYIEGSLTYGINDNTNSRIVNTASLASRTYSASYDSEQISLKVGGGVPNEVMNNMFVTPYASATLTNITTDAYTEKSTVANDALRLTIAQDDINSMVGTVGVKAQWVTDNGTPMISLAVNNEFGDTTINSLNTYQGGGTRFQTSTDVEELSGTLGLGYSFGNDVTSLNINYEGTADDNKYLNHYGTVKIVAKF